MRVFCGKGAVLHALLLLALLSLVDSMLVWAIRGWGDASTFLSYFLIGAAPYLAYVWFRESKKQALQIGVVVGLVDIVFRMWAQLEMVRREEPELFLKWPPVAMFLIGLPVGIALTERGRNLVVLAIACSSAICAMVMIVSPINTYYTHILPYSIFVISAFFLRSRRRVIAMALVLFCLQVLIVVGVRIMVPIPSTLGSWSGTETAYAAIVNAVLPPLLLGAVGMPLAFLLAPRVEERVAWIARIGDDDRTGTEAED